MNEGKINSMVNDLVAIAIDTASTRNGFDFDALEEAIPLAKKKVLEWNEYNNRVMDFEAKIESLVKEFETSENIIINRIELVGESHTAKIYIGKW